VKRKQKQTGVTLIELIIVLVIAGILATMAAPSFSDLINKTRQNSAMSQLSGDLNRARGEAIKRNQRVLLCIRSTDTVCDNSITNWANGWLVCYDENQDGVCDTATATNANPIVVRSALSSTLVLIGTSPVRFNPSGTAGGASTLTLGGTWSGAVSSVASIAATGNVTKTH
jgi:type IV fimbrial biogenesis protein FimT